MHRIRTMLGVVGLLCLAASALTALGGCRFFDGRKVRADNAREYPIALQERTDAAISANQALTLDDCVRIALQNNLDVITSEIEQRVAKLERKIAFANFLPVIDLGYMHYEFDPEINLELSDTSLSIDRVRSITWQANMSIFNPATWFLYSMHQSGEEIAELVTTYTRQMTVLQVTVLYYQCLSLEEMDQALNSELAAARETADQLQSLYQEGLLSQWQADQAAVLVQARQLELNRTRRDLASARADLLAAMGLSPLVVVTLERQSPLEAPAGTLEELIAEALLSHPQLQIADRNIEIQAEQVKIAIADFLPQLFGFAMYPDSLDDFVDTSGQWIYGLSGTMTLFNGFANVNEYKAARERQREGFFNREQASLAVILEVYQAYLMLQTTSEQMALAENAYDVTVRRLAEAEQKWHEGLIDSAEMLDLTSQRDEARAQAVAAGFQHQVTIATLLNVMGKTNIDIEEPEHDGQSQE